MNWFKQTMLTAALCGAALLSVQANNLQLTGLDMPDSQHVNLTIQWAHSWALDTVQPPYNHDAVWLFLKYQDSSALWKHADLSATASDHSADTLLEVIPAPDRKGVIIRRAAAGAGHIPPVTLQLRLYESLDPQAVNIRALGIEMVYVPEGAFYLGDAASENTFRPGNTLAPFSVNDAGTIPAGSGAGELTSNDEYPPESDIPAAYPNGYNSFYCMKYEISQVQYRDFLHTLTYPQQQARTAVSPNAEAGTPAMATGSTTNRNGVIVAKPGTPGAQTARYACNANMDDTYDAEADGHYRAANFLKWADLAAYLDWAALRPMTELEFEKACRGPEYPEPRAFAWNTPYIINARTVVQDGTPQESVTQTAQADSGLANHGYNDPPGPLRNGFGATPTSDRLQAGAAYYGALEMSGNLWELCITVNTQGLGFTGTHGDGQTDSNGNADVTGWPLTDGTGAGFRGGGWNSGIFNEFRDLAVSDRFYAGLKPETRRNTNGGRGVRSW